MPYYSFNTICTINISILMMLMATFMSTLPSPVMAMQHGQSMIAPATQVQNASHTSPHHEAAQADTPSHCDTAAPLQSDNDNRCQIDCTMLLAVLPTTGHFIQQNVQRSASIFGIDSPLSSSINTPLRPPIR